MAKSSIWQRIFDRERDFVANKVMTLGGQALVPGDPIDKTLVNTRRLRQMYEARLVLMVDKVEGEAETIIETIENDIADGWRDLPWMAAKGEATIRQLAAKFYTSVIKNKEAAIAIIEAELARREAATNPPADDAPPQDPFADDVADPPSDPAPEIVETPAETPPPAEPAAEPAAAEPAPAEVTEDPAPATAEAETTEETKPAGTDGQSA